MTTPARKTASVLPDRIEPGQVWQDKDAREMERQIRVEAVVGGYVEGVTIRRPMRRFDVGKPVRVKIHNLRSRWLYVPSAKAD